MVQGRVSIIIPSRNEEFLPQTVADLLAKATGDVEIIVVLDGYWPNPPLPADPRLHILHRGTAQSMRPGINAAAQIATGEYFMKIDAHCMVEHGFDEALKADCDRDWVVVPRRYSLDPENWQRVMPGIGVPIDQHYLSYPFETMPSGELKPGAGLHGTPWKTRIKARADILIDDEMSSQGSCWFMSRQHWDLTVGPMDFVNYGSFIQEFQEIGMKTWLSGGRVICNKKTWYAHLHKGTRGRGYFIDKREWDRGSKFAIWFWLQDEPFAGRQHSMRWLIEKFGPVPGWPEDLDHAFAFAQAQIKGMGFAA